MAVSKFRIYDYWKDKAITKKFEIKPVSACTKEDDALSITEFPDEIFCWACQMPPYQQGTHRTLSGLWNGDTLLQRSHILEKSLNGEDKPENYFLLCPQCHAESPDTTDAKLFFAWVRYKRTHENYSMVLRRDMKKAAEILGVDQNLVEERFAALRLTREEVFGPVVNLVRVSDAEEALQLANDTEYGLTASVWTQNISKALEYTDRLQAGTVWVNSHTLIDANLPFGGMKQSGTGRDFGPDWLDGWCETKSVCVRY